MTVTARLRLVPGVAALRAEAGAEWRRLVASASERRRRALLEVALADLSAAERATALETRAVALREALRQAVARYRHAEASWLAKAAKSRQRHLKALTRLREQDLPAVEGRLRDLLARVEAEYRRFDEEWERATPVAL